MSFLAEKHKCNGCMACYNVCPFDAIDIVQDEKGFYCPQIDVEKCTKCKKCKKVCPVQNQKEESSDRDEIEVVACWTKNSSLRNDSTSGGIFSVFMEEVARNNGMVCGAAYDEHFNVIHVLKDDVNDFAQLRGSKYVQSNVGNIYKKIKIQLETGKLILFSGTPCQNDALLNYLGKEYLNLITVDIICHGVPSPLIFQSYLKYIKEGFGNGNDIKDIKFRFKKPSWTVFSMKIDFLDGTTYINDMYNDPYLQSFLKDFITRESCHNCIYTTAERKSDITIADFWGYMSEKKDYKNDEKGISLVLLNSKKGKEFFRTIKPNIVSTNKTLEEAKKGNRCLIKPFDPNPENMQYWDDFYRTRDFKKIKEKYFNTKGKMSFKFAFNQCYRNHAYIIPKFIQVILNSVIYKLKQFIK